MLPRPQCADNSHQRVNELMRRKYLLKKNKKNKKTHSELKKAIGSPRSVSEGLTYFNVINVYDEKEVKNRRQ